MPKTIETVVYTLEELYERGDSNATDRALDWMREVWSDHVVESVTEAIDHILTELCGGEYRPSLGRREGPITWVEWDIYPRRVTLEGDFTPDQLDTSNFVPFPCPESVERVQLTHYGLELTMTDVNNVEEDTCEELVRDWLNYLHNLLERVMVSEYEYLNSEEYLRETAAANEYTFTAYGKRFG